MKKETNETVATATNEAIADATGTALAAAPQAGALAVGGAARGFENVDLESVTMPTAKVLQPISKEVADDEYSDYNFKAGNIIHSLLLEKLPETFVPIIMFDNKIMFVPKNDNDKAALKAKVKERFGIELTDDDMKSSFVCRSTDNKYGDRFGDCSKCGLCEFNGNEAPLCTKNINVLSLFEEQQLPVVLRFSATSYKHGKAFKNLAYFSGGDLFSRKYKVTSVKKTGDGNTWYEITVKPAGKTEETTYAVAEQMYQQFKDMMIEVHEVEEQAATESGSVQGEF